MQLVLVANVGWLPTHSRVVLVAQYHRRCRLTESADTGYPKVGRVWGRGRVAVRAVWGVDYGACTGHVTEGCLACGTHLATSSVSSLTKYSRSTVMILVLNWARVMSGGFWVRRLAGA